MGDTGAPGFTGRPLPRWFDEAKLGILVHWGPSSVPGWAPPGASPFAIAAEHGWAEAFRRTPYAEWYWNSLSLPGSPTAAHHATTWGDTPYEAFGPLFEAAAQAWDPQRWAAQFAAAGARYVVMVTKHHDGYCLWPTAVPNHRFGRWHSGRDLVGELAEAVRGHNMRFGTYYSGGLDWTYTGPGVDSFESLVAHIPTSGEYLAAIEAHVGELIERYRPDVLWNDIHWPGDACRVFEAYYAAVPDGVVNDRFDVMGVAAGRAHADFTTPEYASRDEPGGRKWEACRGLGGSFGFNRAEGDGDHLAPAALVRHVVDVVAAGGNALVGVGPMADGTIPFPQAHRLAALGAWLGQHGAAVYGAKPWRHGHRGTLAGSPAPVCWAERDDRVYALVPGDAVGTSPGAEVAFDGVAIDPGARVGVVGGAGAAVVGPGTVRLTDHDPGAPVVAVEVAPAVAVRREGTPNTGKNSVNGP